MKSPGVLFCHYFAFIKTDIAFLCKVDFDYLRDFSGYLYVCFVSVVAIPVYRPVGSCCEGYSTV